MSINFVVVLNKSGGSNVRLLYSSDLPKDEMEYSLNLKRRERETMEMGTKRQVISRTFMLLKLLLIFSNTSLFAKY
jgi:hypothetical protein